MVTAEAAVALPVLVLVAAGFMTTFGAGAPAWTVAIGMLLVVSFWDYDFIRMYPDFL